MIHDHLLISPKKSAIKNKAATGDLTHMYLLYVLFCMLYACEHTKIYADPQNELNTSMESSVSLGFCQEDTDCPQWSCIQGKCEDGVCQALRADVILSTVSLLENEKLEGRVVLDTHLDEQSLYVLSASDSTADARLNHWRWENKQWSLQDEQIDLPYMQKIYIQDDLYFGIEGEDQRTLRFFTSQQVAGNTVTLSDYAYSLMMEAGTVWVSTFQKGVTLVDPQLLAEGVSLPRFDTAGRALDLAIGRSYLVVADGYAGLSVFLRRAYNNIQESARALQTPAQEMSTQGRVVSVDLLEGKILTAEWGAGVGLYQIDPITGLKKLWVHGLNGVVLAAQLLDPYTALVWVENQAVVMLDLVGSEPKVMARLDLQDVTSTSGTIKEELENILMTQQDRLPYIWQGKNGHIIGGNAHGKLWSARYQCSFNNENQ